MTSACRCGRSSRPSVLFASLSVRRPPIFEVSKLFRIPPCPHAPGRRGIRDFCPHVPDSQSLRAFFHQRGIIAEPLRAFTRAASPAASRSVSFSPLPRAASPASSRSVFFSPLWASAGSRSSEPPSFFAFLRVHILPIVEASELFPSTKQTRRAHPSFAAHRVSSRIAFRVSVGPSCAAERIAPGRSTPRGPMRQGFWTCPCPRGCLCEASSRSPSRAELKGSITRRVPAGPSQEDPELHEPGASWIPVRERDLNSRSTRARPHTPSPHQRGGAGAAKANLEKILRFRLHVTTQANLQATFRTIREVTPRTNPRVNFYPSLFPRQFANRSQATLQSIATQLPTPFFRPSPHISSLHVLSHHTHPVPSHRSSLLISSHIIYARTSSHLLSPRLLTSTLSLVSLALSMLLTEPLPRTSSRPLSKPLSKPFFRPLSSQIALSPCANEARSNATCNTCSRHARDPKSERARHNRSVSARDTQVALHANLQATL